MSRNLPAEPHRTGVTLLGMTSQLAEAALNRPSALSALARIHDTHGYRRRSFVS
jgi:hypothetical protein